MKRYIPEEVLRIRRVVRLGLALFAALWLMFYATYSYFPYIKAGADIVEKWKHELARTGDPFAAGRTQNVCRRVMIFGDSRMLAAFIPALFDSELAAAGFPGIQSYNFGLPGDTRFVTDLELMTRRGTGPDLALLTSPWPDQPDPGPTFFHFLPDDKDLMEKLFPFHHLPRDFLIFALQAHGTPRGMKDLYQDNERTIRQVATDRGYYFIARQSHYPNNELPQGFRLPNDTPHTVNTRTVTRGPVFEHLAAVNATRNVRSVFVPVYFREGQYAAPPALNTATAAALAGTSMDVIGPDYFLYSRELFSDPTHTNKRGAQIYTRAVAALVAGWLRQQQPPAASRSNTMLQ